MKIAIDMDDCITNTQELDFACAWNYNKQNHPNDEKFHYGINHDATKIFKFTNEEKYSFYIKQRKYIIKNKLIDPKPFVKEVINQLLHDGHEIYIVTSREDEYWNGNAKRETEKWLKKHGIKFTKLFVNCLDKGAKCAELGVHILVDDNQKYARQVNSQGIRTIVFTAPYNKNYKNILSTHASCWPEVYYIIKGLVISLGDIQV